MAINTQHPQYKKIARSWAKMDDALDEEDHVKGRGEAYIKMTGGMKSRGEAGRADHAAFIDRARFPQITGQALTGIVGLVFEDDPTGASDEIITNTGQTNTELARDCIRSVSSKGRSPLVVDAPSGGGDPYIARYPAESLINWRLKDGNQSLLTMAVLVEQVTDPDETDIYSHKTVERFRRYMLTETGQVEVSLWAQTKGVDELVEAPSILPGITEIPVFIAGSIDTTPDVDPIPLMPVANCAFSYFRKSASHEQAMHLTTSPTAWVKGVPEDLYDKLLDLGIGAGVLWFLGDEGEAGFLEVTADGLKHLQSSMQDELKQAETYAVRLSQQTDGTESGVALKTRATTQHASIYSMADSTSIAIARAQNMRAKWAGKPEPEPFVLQTDYSSDYAGEQMITALSHGVNSGNIPMSALFEAIRKSGLSTLSNDEMLAEIETAGGFVLADNPVVDAAAIKPVNAAQ